MKKNKNKKTKNKKKKKKQKNKKQKQTKKQKQIQNVFYKNRKIRGSTLIFFLIYVSIQNLI